MKRLGLVIALTAVGLVGCRNSTTAVPNAPAIFAPGGNISNLNGTGSGKVWGIDIAVVETGGGNVDSRFEGTVRGDATKTDAKQTIEVGTVTIELIKKSTNPIEFSVNGKTYGEIQVGDALSIDADRNVMVNGQTRTPN